MMTETLISDVNLEAAIEAGAKALDPSAWDNPLMYQHIRDEHRERSRTVLTAALPHLVARIKELTEQIEFRDEDIEDWKFVVKKDAARIEELEGQVARVTALCDQRDAEATKVVPFALGGRKAYGRLSTKDVRAALAAPDVGEGK